MGGNGAFSTLNQTICWNCANALGGCSWSEEFVPVNGWTAEKTFLKGNGHMNDSYRVTACPLFVGDDEVKETRAIKSAISL